MNLQNAVIYWFTVHFVKNGDIVELLINDEWEKISPEEKKRKLYEWQVDTMDTVLEHGAIRQGQHDKSLHKLTVKMGYGE